MTPGAPRHIAVGRIGRAHGVRGEVRVDVLTDFPDRFSPGARFFIGSASAAHVEPAVCLTVRPHKGWLLARFDVTPDRESAALLAGMYIYVPVEELRELAEDTYYHHQLVGLDVFLADGERVGTVAEILETGSADVLVIRDGDTVRMVPMIADVVAQIDLVAGQIVITPLPGLLD